MRWKLIGAGSPKEAVSKAITALQNGDLIGLLDDMPPGERAAISGPFQDDVTSLKRLGVLSPAADRPDGQSTPWNKYLVTHRGAFSNGPGDDLWAFDTTNDNLYLYKNTPATAPFQSLTSAVNLTKSGVTTDSGNVACFSRRVVDIACAGSLSKSCNHFSARASTFPASTNSSTKPIANACSESSIAPDTMSRSAR